MTRALWHGEVLAESDETRIVEGNHYFPAGSVRDDLFLAIPSTTRCFWKGRPGTSRSRWARTSRSMLPGPIRSRGHWHARSVTTWRSAAGSTSSREDAVDAPGSPPEFVVLLVAPIFDVYNPRGMTRYGRRRQRQQRLRSRPWPAGVHATRARPTAIRA